MVIDHYISVLPHSCMGEMDLNCIYYFNSKCLILNFDAYIFFLHTMTRVQLFYEE